MIVAPGLIRGTPRYTRGRQIFSQLNPTRYVAPGTLSSPFTFTRAQAAGVESTGLSSDGVTWQKYGADTARYFGTEQLLAIEVQRSTGIRNPRGEGAVAGTPGTLPTNASATLGAGLSREVVGSYTINGVDVVRIRVTGTYSGDSEGLALYYLPDTQLLGTMAVGRAATASMFLRLVSGSFPASTSGPLRIVAEEWTTTTLLATRVSEPVSLTSTLTRPFLNILGQVTGVTRVRGAFQVYVNPGESVDFTIDIGWPQTEIFSFIPSTPILPPVGTYPSSTTRGTDLVAASLSSLGLGANGACTILWAGSVFNTNYSTAGGEALTLVNVGDASGTIRCELRITNVGLPVMQRVTSGGASGVTFGAAVVPPNQLIRAGMTIYGDGKVAAAFAGYGDSQFREVGGAETVLNTELRLGGNGTAGARAMQGVTNALYVSPTPVSGADLAATVAAFPI